jgi:hypothetical protein
LLLTHIFPFPVALYLTTTVIASIIGILSILCFQGTFTEGEFETSPPATVELGCNEPDMYLSEGGNGTVSCSAMDGDSSQFFIYDVTGSFSKSGSGPQSGVSMSDTVYDGIFLKIVSNKYVLFLVDLSVYICNLFDRLLPNRCLFCFCIHAASLQSLRMRTLRL